MWCSFGRPACGRRGCLAPSPLARAPRACPNPPPQQQCPSALANPVPSCGSRRALWTRAVQAGGHTPAKWLSSVCKSYCWICTISTPKGFMRDASMARAPAQPLLRPLGALTKEALQGPAPQTRKSPNAPKPECISSPAVAILTFGRPCALRAPWDTCGLEFTLRAIAAPEAAACQGIAHARRPPPPRPRARVRPCCRTLPLLFRSANACCSVAAQSSQAKPHSIKQPSRHPGPSKPVLKHTIGDLWFRVQHICSQKVQCICNACQPDRKSVV